MSKATEKFNLYQYKGHFDTLISELSTYTEITFLQCAFAHLLRRPNLFEYIFILHLRRHLTQK